MYNMIDLELFPHALNEFPYFNFLLSEVNTGCYWMKVIILSIRLS
jgi:hypothetical protein